MSREVSYPVPYQRLRQLCIEEPGLNLSERVFWWSLFVRTAENQEVKAAFSLANASSRFRKACKTLGFRKHSSEQPFTMVEVFNVIVRSYHVPLRDIPFVQRLFYILYSGLEPSYQCPVILFDIFEELLKNSKFHLSLSSLPVLEQTFIALLSSHMPKTFSKLQKMQALEFHHLHHFFFDFFTKLLSMNDVLRIMDIYLLEGTKALLKYAMGMIFEQKDSIKLGKFKDGDDLWKFLLSRGGKIKHPFVFKRVHSFAFEEELNKRVIRLKLFALSSSSFRTAFTSAKKKVSSEISSAESLLAQNNELIFEWQIDESVTKDEAKAYMEEEEEDDGWDDDTTATAIDLVVNNPMQHDTSPDDHFVDVYPPEAKKLSSCCCF